MAKQPRQQIQDLQGYDNVATPSATPVDTYTGKIGTPSQSSAQQLASAFGSMANQGAKIYADQKAEELKENQTLQQQRVETYIGAFTATKDNPTLDVGDVRGLAPDVDLSVIGGLIEQDHYSSYYASAYNLLSNLSDAEKLDPERLLAAGNGLKAQAQAEVQGDFALAGTLKGIDTAIQSVLTGNEGKLKEHQIKKHEHSSYGMLFSIYSRSGDLSKPENLENFMQGLIDQDAIYLGDDEVKGTSPFNDQTKEKALLRTNIEKLVKQYPEQGLQILNAFEQLPWEGDETTEPFVYGLREQVTIRLAQKLEINSAQIKAEVEAGKTQLNVDIRNMRANGDTKGLNEIAFGVIDIANMSDADIELAMLKQDRALQALSADVVSKQVSDQNKNALFTKISTAAYTKDFTFLGFEEGVVPNPIELQDAIYKRGDLNFTEQSTLATNMEKILQGYSSIDLTKIRSQVERTYSAALVNYDQPQYKGLDPAGLITDAYVSSMQQQLDIHYADLDNAGQPSPDKLIAFRVEADKAALAVKQDLDALRLIRVGTPEGDAQIKQIKSRLEGEQPPATDLQLEVGKEYPHPDGGLVRYLGGDPNDDSSFEKVETEEDPYAVTSEGDELSGNARQRKAQIKKNEEAQEAVGNIFNKETASFDLDESTLSTIEQLVEGRYRRASKRKHEVSEDSIMEIVLDQLGLDGVSDFEYGGMFGDEVDTAGEVAIKKIVDSLMEKHIGE